jgi:hypothetical protein
MIRTLSNHIDRLKEDISEKQAEVDRLTELSRSFSDLKRFEGIGDNHVVFFSFTANELVTNFVRRRDTSPEYSVVVWPYLETDLGRVYSNPPYFIVGKLHPQGDIPKPGWEEELRKAKITEVVIAKVQEYFEETSCSI